MNIEEIFNKKISEYGLSNEISIQENKVRWEKHQWEYKIPTSLSDFHRRTLEDIFPFSPFAIKREEIWASVISGLLEQSPQIKIDKNFIDNLVQAQVINYKGEKEELKSSLKAILEDLYYIESKSVRKVPYILPFHLQIIGNLKSEEARGFDRLFRLLLLDENGQFNKDLFDRILELFDNENTLTPIDELLIKSIKEKYASQYHENKPKVKDYGQIRLEGYDFYKQQAILLQRDLNRILDFKVSRTDKVRYFTIILGLHFAIYIIRISYYLDWEYSAFIKYLENQSNTFKKREAYDDDFRNKIPFTFRELRTMSTSQPVLNCGEMSQVVYRSYIHMILLNTVRNMFQNMPLTFYEIAQNLKNVDVRKWIDICFELQMISYVHTVIKQNDEKEIGSYLSTLPEGNAFKRYEALVTKHFATQKSSNRTPARAGIGVIKQLVGTEANYSIISSKQRIGDYYSMDKDLIILLVHLTVDANEKKIRYKDFLNRISDYGFVPDQHAEESLIKKLEETGLLQKFSDSGEAMYVRTIF